MLAEELLVIDGGSPLWPTARPLLDAALRLEQGDATWHGWHKTQIAAFLESLPTHCSLIAGVWETLTQENGADAAERLVLGIVCEVIEGQICSIRTFEALCAAGLKPTHRLEPGIDDAVEIMRAAKAQVAPVAWALFTDRPTWNEWLFAEGAAIDKGALLVELARQGRCVLLGSGNESQMHSPHHRL